MALVPAERQNTTDKKPRCHLPPSADGVPAAWWRRKSDPCWVAGACRVAPALGPNLARMGPGRWQAVPAIDAARPPVHAAGAAVRRILRAQARMAIVQPRPGAGRSALGSAAGNGGRQAFQTADSFSPWWVLALLGQSGYRSVSIIHGNSDAPSRVSVVQAASSLLRCVRVVPHVSS